MRDIKDSVAVITGGGGGIGTALARYWLLNGGRVLLSDVAHDILDRAEADIGAVNGRVATMVCNVANEEECAKLADYAIDMYGRINLVAPFAGIIKDGLMLNVSMGKVGAKMSLAQFQRVIDINLTGVFLTIRECIERMIDNGCSGLVCLISSTSSLGTAGQINYSSSKAAVSVMPSVITAELFRRGLADRIRCVAVAPGYVETPMVKKINRKALDKILEQVPIGRLILPEEIASLIGELYRNEALAGSVHFIHGGLRLGSMG